MKTKGVSNIKYPNGNETVELTKEELEQIADDYARCARLAKSFGVDGCVLHAGHGNNLLDNSGQAIQISGPMNSAEAWKPGKVPADGPQAHSGGRGGGVYY